MKYLIESTDSPFAVDLTEYFNKNGLKSLDDIDESNLCEYLFDEFSDKMWDYIQDAYDCLQDIKGSFNLEEAEKRVLTHAIAYLESKRDDYLFYIKAKDENDKEYCRRQVSFVSTLLDQVEAEAGDCFFYSRVGSYIERSLSAFIKNSVWHCGLVDKEGKVIASDQALKNKKSLIQSGNTTCVPVVWFGTDANSVEKKWSFGLGKEDYSLFLICDDIYYLVDNANAPFGIWYSAECGYWVPYYPEDIPPCSVDIKEDDDDELIREKIVAYINSL